MRPQRRSTQARPRRRQRSWPAPFYLLWSYRRRPPTTINILRAGDAFHAQNRGAETHPYARRGRFSMWLVWFPVRLVGSLWLLGPAARTAFGRPLLGQAIDMMRVALANDVMPYDYYNGGLARYGGGREMFRYISFRIFSNAAALCHSRYPHHGAIWELDRDKLEFELACRAHGLPCVETLAAISADGLIDPVGAVLPQRPLFVKPVRGSQGTGAERWDYRNGGYVKAGAENGALAPAHLLEHLRHVAAQRKRKLLVQTVLRNHPDLRPLVGEALATVRLITIADESGRPVVVFGYWRVPALPGSVVDNYVAGGLMFPIDVATGKLAAGRFLTYRFRPEAHTVNPLTGARIAGRELPCWPEVTDLGRDLHRTVGTSALMGWDIAITPDGPVIVESSAMPGFGTDEQAFTDGFVGSPYGELLAAQVERALTKLTPEDSRWRVGADLD